MLNEITSIKAIKLGIVVLCMMTATPLFSQGIDYTVKPKKINYKNEWNKGLVTFHDGKTIQCELSYNPSAAENSLKIKEGNKIIKGTVSNVKSFAYYDEANSSEHKYFCFSVSNNKRMFVELLYKDAFYSILGGKSILSSKKVENTNTITSDNNIQYQKFLIDIEQGLMYDLTPVNLKSIMQDKEKEIKDFISTRQLQFKSIQDYTLVIKEYERLTK
ncbi:hypothetical protein [Catalinimonas niigatensis]|uniref:hypothetical protein n=1 Tax=Catalinimonas niigatensis TaxID=1397264 RepID=UPI00266530F8|nr:hypothetical protein [Catalinimonas niigatensis]WPP50827.1 hypothetical protein PZB72_00265 [Catalinimonas niigatensis]